MILECEQALVDRVFQPVADWFCDTFHMDNFSLALTLLDMGLLAYVLFVAGSSIEQLRTGVRLWDLGISDSILLLNVPCIIYVRNKVCDDKQKYEHLVEQGALPARGVVGDVLSIFRGTQVLMALVIFLFLTTGVPLRLFVVEGAIWSLATSSASYFHLCFPRPPRARRQNAPQAASLLAPISA